MAFCKLPAPSGARESLWNGASAMGWVAANHFQLRSRNVISTVSAPLRFTLFCVRHGQLSSLFLPQFFPLSLFFSPWFDVRSAYHFNDNTPFFLTLFFFLSSIILSTRVCVYVDYVHTFSLHRYLVFLSSNKENIVSS